MSSSDCPDWSRDITVPRIKSVTPQKGRYLLVTFVNGVHKVYDCQKILNLERFRLLRRAAFFNAVTVDSGGYGVSWDDEIDLSEYELWTNGVDTEQSLRSEEGAVALPV
ncbi:MAG: DUF2442 domain-containing protein [Caldilineaceae bacterium]|nr:DUF2442 domain-containing protein [Caldilineaceae bacterium]